MLLGSVRFRGFSVKNEEVIIFSPSILAPNGASESCPFERARQKSGQFQVQSYLEVLQSLNENETLATESTMSGSSQDKTKAARKTCRTWSCLTNSEGQCCVSSGDSGFRVLLLLPLFLFQPFWCSHTVGLSFLRALMGADRDSYSGRMLQAVSLLAVLKLTPRFL